MYEDLDNFFKEKLKITEKTVEESGKKTDLLKDRDRKATG